MQLVICNNSKENFSREPEKMNVKFHKIICYTWNFQNLTCVFTILVKFDFYFLGLPWKIFFKLVLLQMTNYIFSTWKM